MEREFFRLDEISWRGLAVDLLRNFWMILLEHICCIMYLINHWSFG